MKKFQAVAILALAPLVGCSGTEEDRYQLVKVTGTITKNGKPLADADVSFVPGSGNQVSTPGVDRSGPQGTYMLSFKGRTGVAPGKYKVLITPPVEVPAGAAIPDAFKNDPVMFRTSLKARSAGQNKATEVKKEIVRSEFNAEVDEKDVNVTLDFDVKS